MNAPQPDMPGEPERPRNAAADGSLRTSPDLAYSIHTIFIGRDGLRAIWGILLFLLLREILRYAVYPVVESLFPYPTDRAVAIPPAPLFVYEGAGFFCIAFATGFMSRVERRRIETYGFNRDRGLRNFCTGLASGAALLSLLIALLRVTGLLVFDGRLLSGASIFGYGSIWLAGFLLVAMLEETFSRGYLQFTLTRGLSALYRRLFGASTSNALAFWTTALALSFCFGYGHRTNPGESPLGLASAGVAGLLFCLSLWRTGSLWWAIGFHAAWDWSQSFLYGVADSGLVSAGHLYATHPVGRPILSGGLTGPEGSVLLLPVMAIGAATVLLSLPRTHRGYLPIEAPDTTAQLDFSVSHE